MIIGIAGLNCSGKDTVAEYLQEKSFMHISLSSILRKKLTEDGKKTNRDTLISEGNKLRSKEGAGILARLALRGIDPNRNYCITSIRNPTEIDVLKTRKDFLLVAVEAPTEKRYERCKKRGRDTVKTLTEFQKQEAKEQSTDENAQQLSRCAGLAKVVIRNTGTVALLRKKVDKMLEKWRPILEKRPTWDEYFMGLVHAASARATCDRGKTACVMVRDKRILATGYVGAPMGVPDCYEVGHQMKKTIHEDGKITNHCVRTTHAEANAIALAARNGVSLDGATAYMKMTPCYTCAKLMINAGIVRIVCERDYHASADSKKIFKQAGLKLEILNDEVMKYGKQ